MTLWYHEGARKRETSTVHLPSHLYSTCALLAVLVINCFILSVAGEPTAHRVHSILTTINQSKTLDWSLQLVSALRLGLSTDARKRLTPTVSRLAGFPSDCGVSVSSLTVSEPLKKKKIHIPLMQSFSEFKAFKGDVEKGRRYIFSLHVVLSDLLQAVNTCKRGERCSGTRRNFFPD